MRAGGAGRGPLCSQINTGGGAGRTPGLPATGAAAQGSGVLAEVAAAGGAVGAGLQPLHDVLEVAAVATALAPDEEPLHDVVADGTHAGTLPTPAPERRESPQRGSQRGQGPPTPSGPPFGDQSTVPTSLPAP